MGLFTESVGQYKSTWHENGEICFEVGTPRNIQRARAERLAEQNRELKLQTERLAEQLQESGELQRLQRHSPV